MENQEILKAIAVLADKTGRYHERLLAVERDNLRLEKELDEHKNGCQCNSTEPKKAYEEDDCPACGA
jgi:hypothetical protein